MPELAGISHISLSVTDRDAARDWYCDVLGFRVLEENNQDVFKEWILAHPTGMVLCLQQHYSNAGETFSPERTGLDHLGFRVSERTELDDWTQLFVEKGVKHSPIVDAHYGSVLCFRGPDAVQLELFYRENHP